MQVEPIAHIRTCYGEKFGIPRQPGLVEEAWGRIEFTPDYAVQEALRGLEGFSHLWLIFWFHQAAETTWKPTVRPPRLGGNQRVGVFSSRSPFRPNPLGLSVVAIDRIEEVDSGSVIHVKGVDLVDGTPVLDIKPYIPYSDAYPEAESGYVTGIPPKLAVKWMVERPEARLARLIEMTLANDPRPAYQKDSERTYGCMIENVNVSWMVKEEEIEITSLEMLDKSRHGIKGN